MTRLFGFVEAALDSLSTLLVAVCLGAVSIQIVMRYIFDNATTWSDPIAASCLAWLTFLAATSAVRKDENLSVRLLWSYLGPTGKKIAETFSLLVILVFSLVLAYTGAQLMGVTSTALVEGLIIEVSWGQMYSVTVLSGVLMTVFALERIAAVWLARPR